MLTLGEVDCDVDFEALLGDIVARESEGLDGVVDVGR
jgi:hypothetical protein